MKKALIFAFLAVILTFTAFSSVDAISNVEYCLNYGDATDLLKSITGKDGKIDYSSMPSKLKRVTTVPIFDTISILDEDTGEMTDRQVITGYRNEEGRDLTATVSVLIKAIQEQQATIDCMKAATNIADIGKCG